MERILIVRLTALGDVLLATPLLRALRRAHPSAHIDWLVAGPLLPLLTENPHLTRAITDTPGGRRKLFEQRYDLVLDLQNKPRTAWLRLRLWPRRTLALRKRSIGRATASLFGRDPPERGPSAVERNLALTTPLGIARAGTELDLRVPPMGALEVGPLLSRAPRRPIGLAPGARWATKRWPHFAELAARLAASGHPILGLGGAADSDAIERVRRSAGAAYLGDTCGLSVAGLSAAIAGCAAVITNDSGPAHLAAALGTPALVVFGPTSPERWAPPGSAVRVISRELACSPCSNHGSERCPLGTHACLRELSAAEVLQALPESWLRPAGESH